MNKTVVANGIRINVRLDGPEDAPVVMFSNSLMSNLTMWDPQIPALAAQYRVLRYDQRGHGGTEVTPAPYNVEQLTDDAYAVLETLGIDSVHFVGLSMGGFTGQILAARHPEKVRSLVLADTACAMPPASMWNERVSMARSQGIESLVQSTLERWFTAPFHVTGTRELDAVRDMIRATDVEGYSGCAEAIRDMQICGDLPLIAVPTLILVGESDSSCPVASAEQMHAGIKDSTLLVLKNAAHLPNIEQSDAFNEALLGFLSRH